MTAERTPIAADRGRSRWGTTARGDGRAAAIDREERRREVHVNQRISQPLAAPQSSRPMRRHRFRLRTAALLASAIAAGAVSIVVANGISGGDGIQGTGHTSTANDRVITADNGVISANGAIVLPADNGILTCDEAVAPADNGVINADGVTPADGGVISTD
jgi:hypothetical protein